MKLLKYLMVLLPLQVFCQISYDFETGGVEGWLQGIPGRWGIDSLLPLSGKYSLWHSFDNTEAGTDCISLPLRNLCPSKGTVKWSFLIRHGCEPSSSNNWGVFLISDMPAPEMLPGGKVSGFAAGVNLSGYDDTLRLWKIKNGAVQKFITTSVNWQNDIGTSNSAGIIIVRTLEGGWSITVRLPDGQTYDTFTGTDSELSGTDYFGIFYRYTSTRDRLLWFDDLVIEGPFIEDREPPEIAGYKLSGRNSVEIVMSEEVHQSFITASNFLLNNCVMPVSDAIRSGPATYRLLFEHDLPNKQECQLKVLYACDLDSNCADNLTVWFTPAWAEPGDVIITEIMADPDPPVGLPKKEYLEITCRSQVPLSAGGWNLQAGSRKAMFPDITIHPGEYVILCAAADSALYSVYGKVAGFKSFPELLNQGSVLLITDSSGNMIHGVEYSDRWYNDRLKSGGGWSLEMVDTDFPFHYESNWEVSVSPSGGTPGKPNSVARRNPDILFEGIINVFPGDDNKIIVTFSEPVKVLPRFSGEFYINGQPSNTYELLDPLCTIFSVILPEKPEIRRIYTLSLSSGFTDFAGNMPERRTFRFGIPEPAEKGDVVFNELLFNPLPGDPGYIEFCNLSDKIIDASILSVASKSITTGNVSTPKPLSEYSICILPGAYYTITTDRLAVMARYYSSEADNIFNVKELPSMPDREGHLILFNKQLEIIDEVRYHENQHFSLLTGKEGIALEKINPSASSVIRESWHSASATAGWGTPGTKNSVFIQNIKEEENISFSSSRITPDNDGVEDFLVITYSFPGREVVTNVTIFDENGIPVKKPAVNFFIGQAGMVVWDGTSADGSVVQAGIYIVYITVFDDRGRTGRCKRAVAVLRR